jgi:hypothetical protein
MNEHATIPTDVTHLPLAPHHDLPPPLQRTSTPPEQLGQELTTLIRDAITNAPRSLQKRIGPSELGHDCARRIGYKLADFPENPNQLPNWKATVGTAIHTWLEHVLDNDNLTYANGHNGEERWYVENKVSVGDLNGDDIDGTTDAYDRVTGTVIDWKTCGPAMLKKYRRQISGQYRKQAHLYGRGWQRKGLTVRHVMVVFLPRNGELSETVVWHEPYDVQVALDALERATGIDITVTQLGKAAFQHLPTADAYCNRCPFFRAGSVDPALGCPGHPSGDQERSRDQLAGIV